MVPYQCKGALATISFDDVNAVAELCQDMAQSLTEQLVVIDDEYFHFPLVHGLKRSGRDWQRLQRKY